MIKTILIFLALFSFGYLAGYGDSPTRVDMRYTHTENNFTEYIVNETTCIKYIAKEYAIKTEVPEYVKTYLNLTSGQLNKLKNLRPRGCNNIGCSQGFHQCKEIVIDLFGLPQPKFSERPSYGFDRDFENTQCIPVKTDNNSQVYIWLNGTDWNIVKGSFSYHLNATNYTDINFNDCVFDFDVNHTIRLNHTYEYESLNNTYTETIFNESYTPEVIPRCILKNNLTNILLYHV